MMLRIDGLLVLLAATAAMASMPSEGRGQPVRGVDGGVPENDTASSHRLEVRARKLAERGRDGWARAAGLYVRAAELRGPADRVAAEDLVLAGHLYYYAGLHGASVLAFRSAGRIFLTAGQLDLAAVAFGDGAWVAVQAGLPLDAQELAQWSEVLTRPHQGRQGQQARRPLVVGPARIS